MYIKPLPQMDRIKWLAKFVKPFPMTTAEIIHVAKTWNFDQSTISFLRLFPLTMQFESAEDFLTRAEELDLVIREEYTMPYEEKIYSLQG